MITDGAVPKDRAVTFEDVACGLRPQATSSKVSSYPD